MTGDPPAGSVRVSVEEARSLAVAVSWKICANREDAEVIADHLLDAELRGHVGLARLLPLATREAPCELGPIRVVRETATSALVDGGNHLGFAVAERATRICIDKARGAGIAVVAAKNHRYSGLLSYYAEAVAREGLVAFVTATGYPRVAPYGGREARVGTNPLAFGFPADEPIVVDIATSGISGAELHKRAELEEPLPPGVALDAAGRPTTSAEEALLAGVLLPWGGHRGSALAIAVQLLGVLCGMQAIPAPGEGWAFVVVALDPELFGPRDEFEQRAAELANAVRTAAPAAGFDEVRMPFDRSRAERVRRLSEGVTLPAAVHERLVALARGA